MIGTAPPYSLDTPAFRFRALIALAGRAPIGGERELALAALMAARLAMGMLGPRALSGPARAGRATGARLWLSMLTLPAAARVPISRLVDATGGDDPAQVVDALSDVLKSTGAALDIPSRAEIASLLGGPGRG